MAKIPSSPNHKMRYFCPYCQTKFERNLFPAAVKESINPTLRGDPRSKISVFSGDEMLSKEKGKIRYQLYAFGCYKCEEVTIEVQRKKEIIPSEGDSYDEIEVFPIRPLGQERIPPAEVPPHIAQVYREATRVIGLSSIAAASLARRCLQATLRHSFPLMPKKRTLFDEISWVEENSNLSSELKEVLHSLRDAGNVGAHPDRDEEDKELIELPSDVIDGCLTLLEAIFHERYVQPSERALKLAKLKAAYPQIKKEP